MIARVSLEIALRREFDYAIPPELAGKVDVGSRVQVPFGPRKILGVVTAVAEESGQTSLKPILKIIGEQTLVTPKVLRLARWIGEYYCCAPEIALKSVLPEAVRNEDAGWRERLTVRPLPAMGEFPKLPKRQQDVWNIVEERREILLAELVELAATTAATVRKLEDRGLIEITSEISERDPYAHEQILPSQPLTLNPAQAAALNKITRAMAATMSPGGTGFQPVVPGFQPETGAALTPSPNAPVKPQAPLPLGGTGFQPVVPGILPETGAALTPSPNAPAKPQAPLPLGGTGFQPVVPGFQPGTGAALTPSSNASAKPQAPLPLGGTGFQPVVPGFQPETGAALTPSPNAPAKPQAPLPLGGTGFQPVVPGFQPGTGAALTPSSNASAKPQAPLPLGGTGFQPVVPGFQPETGAALTPSPNAPAKPQAPLPLGGTGFQPVVSGIQPETGAALTPSSNAPAKPQAPLPLGGTGFQPVVPGFQPETGAALTPSPNAPAKPQAPLPLGGTGIQPVVSGFQPETGAALTLSSNASVKPQTAPPNPTASRFPAITEATARKRCLPHFEIPGFTYHVTWQTHNRLLLSPDARAKTLEACRYWHGTKIKCYAACVMPDHVHLLIQPLPIQEGVYSLTEILHSIKSFSANAVNKAMQRNGPVWQTESYDRMIRSETDLHEKWDYIWNNPRQLGLVGPMEEYPYIWTPGGTGFQPVVSGFQPGTGAALTPSSNASTKPQAPLPLGGTGFQPVVSGFQPGTGAALTPSPNTPAKPQAPLPLGGTGFQPVVSGILPGTGAALTPSPNTPAKPQAPLPLGGTGFQPVVSGIQPETGAALTPSPNDSAKPQAPLPLGGTGFQPVVSGIQPGTGAALTPSPNDSAKPQAPLPLGGTGFQPVVSGIQPGTGAALTPSPSAPAKPQAPLPLGGTGIQPVVSGIQPGTGAALTPFPSAPDQLTTPHPNLAGSRFHPAQNTFLLHGVTGSGKTEIYLQAIAHALEQGQGAIVLVPEISLTPQTVERFKARFSSGKLQTLVAVLHSHLSAGERHDEWHKIRQGRARIVIGARSAIFAPVEPLGLIIVDEEHEHTYKQEEAPRYHARDVAVMRGQMERAVVVLGSATPSLESYYNCRRGKFALLELLERVDNQKMPHVRIVDMRQTRRDGKGPPIFSPQLKEAITQRLERKEQTILFLNRRGYSSSLLCEKCGHVCGCPNCSLTLTYHRPEQVLRCHVCGHSEQVPAVCPNEKCRNPGIRYSGLGTQKVEDVLGKLFPHARIQRMDADVMKRKDDYRRVLGEFRHGKIDILIGTQMIAKGLHFPNVTLVGIIYADMALHQPDFRAGERTFQLLTQVAGRAGRGDIEGEVFVQAFTPFHPAIQYARRHDFLGFYEQELEFREQLKYPPVGRVALLTLKGRSEDKVKFSADYLKREVESKVQGTQALPAPGEPGREPARGIADLIIAGPAPAPLVRAENLFRYHIMLRTRAMSRLSQLLAQITIGLTLPDDVTLSVDIDPVDLS